MEYDYNAPAVQVALKAFKNLNNDELRAFYWATQNPKRSGLEQLQPGAEVDVSAVNAPASSSSIIPTTSQGIDDFLAMLHNLKGRSIMTGIPELDEAVAGLERQTLSILAARPSMGKTTLAWQIARNVAAGGLTVLFLSLEVSAASLWAKAVCGAAGLRWRDIRLKGYKDAVPDDVIAYLSSYADEVKGNISERLLVDERPHNTGDVMALADKYHPDLIIADHLRLFKDKGDSEVKRQGEISSRLKEIAKAFNCHVMSAAQLNRGVEARAADDKRPTLADLRDSGEIEENADLVMMIYRDDYYKQSPAGKVSETEILIRKYRDDVGRQMVKLSFDMEHQWFKSAGMRP